ncbi:Rib/alpha-like domain-containing protein [Enterococcus hirae]
MKTRKKLLHSTLILALALGQTSGTVVEAVSMLSSVESIDVKKISKMNEKKTTNKKEVKKDEKRTKEKNTEKDKKVADSTESNKIKSSIESFANPTFELPIPVGADIIAASTDSEKEIGKAVNEFLSKKLNLMIDNSTDDFKVGDTITYKIPGVFLGGNTNGAEIISSEFSDFWENWENSSNYRVTLLNILRGTYALFYVTSESESGNWQMKLVQLNTWGYQVTFTRLKIAPNQPEIFPMEIAYKPTYFYGIVKEYDAIDFSVDFPDAEASIGKLKASIKDSVHTLKQGDEVPNAVEYIESVENTRGNVKYEWKTSPDTSQPGVQEAKIVVSDDSGRTLEVTVPITIMPLPLEMLPKAGEHKVIQYGAVPKAADYFNVVNHYEESTYKIEWVKAPDMNQEGVQTCLAKATSSDGRTADSAVQIEVISNPGLEVKLKPLEERILGVSYPSLSSNFKNYIEEVTLLGEKVDVNELELVVDETTDTNFQTIGQKEVNITVKKKTSEASVWIKGTGTTTVNVLWGNTILMRSIDGHSAGAFTLDVSNSNNDSAALSIRQGLESPLNVAVGKLQDPFKLYYRLDILRNERTIYTQEVTNRATLQEIMNAFGDKENKIEVKIDDIIQITHPGKTANSSVVMIDEEEKDFTYGTENARYRVTAYGLDPAPVITAESARVFFLGEDINQLNPQEFIKNIRLNDQLTSNEQYKINLIDGGILEQLVSKR